MRYVSSSYNFKISPYVKFLIGINVAIWFIFVVVLQGHFLDHLQIYHVFGLLPQKIFADQWIWQLFSYMFIHSSGLFHILFNMFILWMFGSELERLWGSRFFLIYYLFCGVGASLIYLASVWMATSFFGVQEDILSRPVIGASGAVFGLLLAYGYIYGERIIYFMMIFPMKARHFTLLIAAIELVSMLNHGFGSPVANLAHLGGLISGFLFLSFWPIWQKLNVKKWKIAKGRVHLKVLDNDDTTDWH